MSEAMSALGGVSFEGYATVREVGPQGMITVRGTADVLARAVDVPEVRRLADGILWMAPDEVMVLADYAAAEAEAVRLQTALGDAHALVVNVSDARAMIRAEGAGWREVLAKVSPADFAPEAFGPGDFRRTRLAQVPAAVWMEGDGASVVCFRSVARYVFDVLAMGAQPGSEVGVY